MRFKIIARPIKGYDKKISLDFSTMTMSDSPDENYVDIDGNKLINLKIKDLVINADIYEPTTFKLNRIKTKDTKDSTYLLKVDSPELINSDFIILDINYWQFVKIKFLKGEYPFEIIPYNAVILSIIFGSTFSILTSLIINLIKCFCK